MIPFAPLLSPRRGERILLAAALAFVFGACHVEGAADPATDAAARAVATFTRAHAQDGVHASVAGSDCRVLLLASDATFDDELVESIHYGTGGYDAFGGAEQFARDHGFRAVVYRDAGNGLWTYGATTRDEARSIPRCR